MPFPRPRFHAAIAKLTLAPFLFAVFAFTAFALLPCRAHASSQLDTLRLAHPRLLFPDSELPAIKHSIATNPFVKQYFQQQLAVGEKLLTLPPDTYRIAGPEHTLLATSRDMEGRIFTLAGLYRVTGDKRFAKRATEEMLAAAAFPDWYPTHFLDTGEMTAALGLGYDWLYSVLSPADRATIRNAIATKGIDPWLERIKNGEALRHEHNNWNQVCNGGESIGALAIADEDPVRAEAILDHARTAITNIMKLFAPDGGFEEGPGYWNYATSYNVLYIAALDSALGTDFSASDAPGFANTVDYHIQSEGPSHQFANFGDAHADIYPSPQVFWFARRFHRSAYAEYERPVVLNTHLDPNEQKESSRFAILGLFWSALPPVSGDGAPLPLVESFARVSQAYMRGVWNDPNTWYVGFKGGDAHASHGHLDLGSFVMDAFGQRWASDLAGDSYGLPQYFGRLRWTYYRLRTEGHNTLTIDGANEDLDANAPLQATGTAGNTLYSIADLTSAYKDKLTSWSRGISLIDKQRVLVQDEIAPAKPVDVVWNFHTFATVKIAGDGRSATLTENGVTLHAQIVAPATAKFDTASTQVPPPQEPNSGLTNLVIRLDKQAAPATIAVLFSRSGASMASPLKPLAQWPLATLQAQHPRLFLHDSDLPALKRAIAADPFVKDQFEALRAYANHLLTVPPDVYNIGGVEHTLLDTSRDMESRVFALAGVYRITGDKRYAIRATQEMLAAAAFPDWYPTHFLDTGEMTATLGLGYDWLYPVLSPADRATIENAIATKGIDPWLERIKTGEAIHHEHNNWNQVCNGGESIGALAIADKDPVRAAAILDHAHSAITNIMKLFAPDGGFEEGPTYWLYATAYNLMYIDALDTALGTDFGVAKAPGFDSTGDYHIQADGPTYLLANFGDAGMGGASPTAQMFWLAKRFNKPYYAAHERDIARVNSLATPPATAEHGEQADTRTTGRGRFALMLLLWSAQQSQAPGADSKAQLPLVQSFARVDQAYLRSAWNDPNAWYVAFKGGDAHASHGHLDLGSFVMDSLGQRWASDLGPDSYGLPGYFGAKRWSYYRMRTEGHNTLTIDGQNEDLDSKAPLTATGTMGNTLYSIADLGQTYKGKLSSWNRGVALIDKQRVLVEDEIVPAQPVDVVWNFHTFAAVQIDPDGRSAKLTLGGATLDARILSPADARFSTASTQPPPPQEPNPGLTNLVIPLAKQSSPQTIAVLFTKPGDNATSPVKPLADWK